MIIIIRTLHFQIFTPSTSWLKRIYIFFPIHYRKLKNPNFYFILKNILHYHKIVIIKKLFII